MLFIRCTSQIRPNRKHAGTTTLTSCAVGRHNSPRPLQVDFLTLKVVSESHVMWATSVQILVLLGLSVLDLGATDRRQTRIIA